MALPGRCDLGQINCALLTRSGCTKLKDGGGSFCTYVFTCIKGQADGNSAKLLTLSPDWHSGRVKEKIQQNYLSVLPVRTHTKEPLRAFPNLWTCLILFRWYRQFSPLAPYPGHPAEKATSGPRGASSGAAQ